MSTPSVTEFRAEARSWLAARLAPRLDDAGSFGQGSDDVAVFHDLPDDRERELIAALASWQQCKYDAGYVAIDRPADLGGRGLDREYADAFAQEESAFVTPSGHELVSVTANLVAPTVALLGSAEQRARFVEPFLRAEELCCQLFSEPGAGSDLATLGTRARRDGDEWVISGQKVWTSGAQFAAWGELLARTDPDVPKHAGITAFLVPLDAAGIQVRPLRQMSGGTSFNEVILDEVRIPDALRVGDVGGGWKVALTTLGFERGAGSGRHDHIGGGFRQLRLLAQWLDLGDDPIVRQRLAQVYAAERSSALTALRHQARVQAGASPGPEGSIRKLQWTRTMTLVSDVVTELLGQRLAADTGEWGTFAWRQHLLGAPGYRIAGGSDEIQRSIIGERVLGLPSAPRVDRNVAWKDLPK